ncbi:type II secretion system protein GspL [Chromatiales bacterium (ex Bugula neritina AB1)]|nr:type II secretion system protein GspL [Chromatiales bacterium (ex Bugula neritina AB1)]
MAQYLLTYLQRIGDDYLRWAICDTNKKTVRSHDHGSFADAARAGERRSVIMVIAGTEVLLEDVAVPATNLSRALKAVPYALEEQLAQDVEASHFAFGAKLADGKIPVAVIARDSMDWLKSQCKQAGLTPAEVIPETMVLPLVEGRWTVMTNSSHSAVRTSLTKGFSCDTELLPLLLNNSLDSESEIDVDEMVWESLHFSCGKDRYNLRTKQGPIGMRSEVELFADGLSKPSAQPRTSPRINLFQGDYGKSDTIGKAWKPWRLPAALAAALALLWGGSSYLQYNELGQQEKQLRSDMVATFKATFPDARNPANDPVRQFRSRLKVLAGGNGIDDGSFVVMMSALGAALNEIDKPLVKSMNYRSGKLDIELEASTLQDVDKMKSELESEKKLNANVLSANKDKDRIKARVRVESNT